MAQQVVAAAPEEGQTYKTCKLTLVNTGRSDSVIKIRPAQHEAEKIFLDNTQGIERWEAIQRLMQGYARRGTMVSKPVEYHQFPDLKTVAISEEDIPTVELEGAVFTAPAEKKRIGDLAAQMPANATVLEARVGRLESTVAQNNELLSRLIARMPAPAAAPEKSDLEKELFGV